MHAYFLNYLHKLLKWKSLLNYKDILLANFVVPQFIKRSEYKIEWKKSLEITLSGLVSSGMHKSLGGYFSRPFSQRCIPHLLINKDDNNEIEV